MNKTFEDIFFWRFYKLLDNTDLEGEQIDRFLDQLKKDYTVSELSDEDGSYFTIDIIIPAGKSYSLKIQFSIEEEHKYVYLIQNDTQEQWMLGWWDQARWHPYFIHPDEWQQLINYWDSRKDVDTNLSILLLDDFVGVTDKKHQEALADTEAHILKKYKINYADLYANSFYASERFISIDEEKFNWQNDPELGQVFAGDNYSCYSTRNREHLNGKEDFPFVQWKKMIEQL